MIEKPEIVSEVIFRFFHARQKDANTIARKVGISQTRCADIINNYLKPSGEKYFVFESKLNDEKFVV